jgi:hypothetical protein
MNLICLTGPGSTLKDGYAHNQVSILGAWGPA